MNACSNYASMTSRKKNGVCRDRALNFPLTDKRGFNEAVTDEKSVFVKGEILFDDSWIKILRS